MDLLGSADYMSYQVARILDRDAFPRSSIFYNDKTCPEGLDIGRWSEFTRLVHKYCIAEPREKHMASFGKYIGRTSGGNWITLPYPYALMGWVIEQGVNNGRGCMGYTKRCCAWVHRMICATGILTTLHERAKYALNCAHEPWADPNK
jgi:hypothetical protein